MASVTFSSEKKISSADGDIIINNMKKDPDAGILCWRLVAHRVKMNSDIRSGL